MDTVLNEPSKCVQGLWIRVQFADLTKKVAFSFGNSLITNYEARLVDLGTSIGNKSHLKHYKKNTFLLYCTVVVGCISLCCPWPCLNTKGRRP